MNALRVIILLLQIEFYSPRQYANLVFVVSILPRFPASDKIIWLYKSRAEALHKLKSSVLACFASLREKKNSRKDAKHAKENKKMTLNSVSYQNYYLEKK
jgi:hypothetical protein